MLDLSNRPYDNYVVAKGRQTKEWLICWHHCRSANLHLSQSLEGKIVVEKDYAQWLFFCSSVSHGPGAVIKSTHLPLVRYSFKRAR